MNNTHLGKTLEALGRKFQRNYKIWENFEYPPAHDPCAVYYLLNPSAFDCRQVHNLRYLGASACRPLPSQLRSYKRELPWKEAKLAGVR